MPTFRRPTRREVLATGAAVIATSLLPRQRATAAERLSGGVPTGPGSVLGSEAVEPSHPFGVAAGQVIVDGDDVNALARERVQ